MSVVDAVRAAQAGDPAPPEVSRVAEQMSELMRSVLRFRQQFLAAAAHDVEWTAHMILKCVASEGPQRSGAIAQRMDADPSTISRQVAALVRDGLLERRADPVDGRATLLALTPKADDVLKHHDEIRDKHYAFMLADWNERDLRRFADLLERFGEAYDKTKNEWIPSRAATSAAAEGTA